MEKRRDNRGRVLHNGETQRPDGRYMFRYTDGCGERRAVYSWRLVSTDKLKEGQKDSLALRDLEKQIQKELEDGLNVHDANRTTIDDLYIQFMEMRKDLKDGTKYAYRSAYKRYIKPNIGNKIISGIKPSTIQKFYQTLVFERGLSVSTVHIVHCVLRQLFENAVMDKLIRDNPTQRAFGSLKKLTGNSGNLKEPLTVEQQAAFVNYIYLVPAKGRLENLYSVLLGTGMRIGEALGLRWCDCDFENNVIHINHALIYHGGENNKYIPRITTPKTKAGCRDIPMLDDVKIALLQERKVIHPNGKYSTVDGYTDFVFLNSNGNVHCYSYIHEALHRTVKSYNKWEQERAERENRQPSYLPKISPHTFRHTFCTRMCENNMNIKVLQDIMGHTDIKVTLGIYAKATKDKKMEEMHAMNGNIKIL